MFSLARALPSPTSAEECSSLFGWFTGTMARSDSSETCRSALRLFAFSDRSRSWLDREVPEVSRFSCMLFLSVPGFLDYAGPTGHSRSTATGRIAFLVVDRVQRPNSGFFEARSPGPPIPLSTLQPAPRDARRKTRGQDGFALSFLVGLFHSQQHAGLSRRTYDKPVFCPLSCRQACGAGTGGFLRNSDSRLASRSETKGISPTRGTGEPIRNRFRLPEVCHFSVGQGQLPSDKPLTDLPRPGGRRRLRWPCGSGVACWFRRGSRHRCFNSSRQRVSSVGLLLFLTHDLGCGLHHAVPNSRNPKRPLPADSIRSKVCPSTPGEP